MNSKNSLLRGTLLLTIAGLISRMMGFFYRIFLANTIGAEGMGIYQLIFPIYAVCFSLCASGIETAVSKLTAAKHALGKPQEASDVLKVGVTLTLLLSISCSIIIFRCADFIAAVFLKESRCTQLLKILAITIPFGTTQSCICGYYLGKHNAGIPAFSQLIEQTFRIGSVVLLSHIYVTNGMEISPVIAVMGLVIGELFSLLFTSTCFSFHLPTDFHFFPSNSFSAFREIVSLAFPLTASRICMNLLASLEATLIPNALKSYGMNASTALSVYGILNGMALPFILFPNALTGSISMMLLPAVSESQAEGNVHSLKNTIHKTFSFCLLLGFTCLLFFLIFGNFLGTLVFSNALAGDFITVLAWICPFLYLNTTLTSILNGLGKTRITFFNGIFGLFIRIGFIFFIVPNIGIHGYLLGLLTSQLVVTCSCCLHLHNAFYCFQK